MLTRENCKGLWAAIPSAWGVDMGFDSYTFHENVKKLISTGVQAVYTTGSSGEFYSYSFDEFKEMVDALTDAAKNYEVFTGVGNTAACTRDAVKMAEYCAKKGVNAIMPAFPFWLRMRDDECLLFLQEMCSVSSDMGVIHYNTDRSKRLFNGSDYKRILPYLPENFIGSKSTKTDFYYWCGMRHETPELVHLPAEPTFVPSMMTGGKGMITSLINLNPQPFIEWYQMCIDKRWDKAMQFQQKVNDFCLDLLDPIDELGYLDSAIDTAIAVVGGFLKVGNNIRKPYFPVPEDIMTRFRKDLEERYPEFIYA